MAVLMKMQARNDSFSTIFPKTCLGNHDVEKAGKESIERSFNDNNEPFEKDGRNRFCVLIPVYNHKSTVAQVARQALKLNLPVFVVDDGSDDGSYFRVKNIPGVRVLRHNRNLGKGAALMTGFEEALKAGMNWAITLDSDGQHNPMDALSMMKAISEENRPVIVGARTGMTRREVPWTSRFGRKFSNFWVLMSGGPKMSDSQSGFRIYPLPETLNLKIFSRRFQFEVEALVKARWKGIPVVEVPIGVNYHPTGKRISHFRPFVDFVRNSTTFTRLIFQRIFIPLSFRKKQ